MLPSALESNDTASSSQYSVSDSDSEVDWDGRATEVLTIRALPSPMEVWHLYHKLLVATLISQPGPSYLGT